MSADRTGYIAGLRALADLLEQKPNLPLPSSPSLSTAGTNIAWYLFGGVEPLDHAAQKAQAAEIVRAIPGTFDKVDNGDLFRFQGRIGGLPAEVIVDRRAVCERVVVGTRVVEDVEWVCAPLLQPVEVSA